RALHPATSLRPADAGGGQPASRSPHPAFAPTRDRRDRPVPWTLPRRRAADRASLCPRHGDLSYQIHNEIPDESFQSSSDRLGFADRRLVGLHRPAGDRRRRRVYLRDRSAERPVGRSRQLLFATSASIRSSTACWRTRSTSSLASSPTFREPRCVEPPT